MMNLVKNFWNEEDGALGVEYIIMVGVVALGLLALAVAFITAVGTEFSDVQTQLTRIGTEAAVTTPR